MDKNIEKGVFGERRRTSRAVEEFTLGGPKNNPITPRYS